MPHTAYLDARLEQGVLVLTVTRRQIEGEDIAAGIKEELLSAVSKNNATKVILDLKNTRYVSSIAFWPLLALKRLLADQDGRLVITGLTGAVHDVFMTTKMVSVTGSLNAPFEYAPDVATALERLNPPDMPT